ncbi:MAG: cytochrome C assembly protein [Chloroflexi bacterium RBG_16_54_11]|nr:MAG: cytochrome C assembly protein [Chloroflexi bacterium RBG_16_54_11]
MDPKPRLLAILDIVTILLFVTAVGMVFLYAPLEAVMGQVQRVFYFHVANAWVGMLGFLVAAVAGVAFLRKGDRKWDIVGLAAVEISFVFFFIAIVSGSIWARGSWGTWWTWDLRLTTAAIVELLYAAYLMLRQGIEDPDRRARFGAIYAILSFVSVPITFVAIRISRTLHPVIIGSGSGAAQGSFDMTPKMLQTFMFSLLTFSLIFIDLLWHRIRLGRLAENAENMKLKVLQ